MAKKLSVVLTLDDKQFQTGLRKSANSIKKFGKNMSRLGDDLARNITLPILAIGGASVKLASDLEETDSKFRTVFSSIEEQAVKTAQAFQNEFFLAEETSKNLLGSTGDLLVGFGFTEDAALGLSDKVNRLAADLASFQNIEGGTAEASKALTKALVGETESAKALGIVIRQNTAEYKNEVAQIMQSQGVTETQAKAIANLNIAYKQSSKAIGDVSRTSGSLANQSRQLQESLKDLGGQFGKDLIPLAQSVVNVFNKISTVFSGMSPETRENVIQFGLLAAALGPVMKAFSFLSAVAFQALRLFRFIAPAITLMAKAFVTLNPYARLATLAITGLSAALPFIIEKFKGATDEITNFKNMVSTAGNVMKNNPLFDVNNYEKVEKKVEDVVKKFREVASIQPIAISPIQATEGQTSAAPQFATDGSYFEQMQENIIITQNLLTLNDSLTESYQTFGGAIEQAFSSALVSQEGFFKSFIDFSKRALKQILAQIAAMAILNALLGGTRLGGKLGFENIGGFAGIPKMFGFAEGGIVTGATIAMVGEGRGTSMSNPEVIAPLDKLQGMINTSGNGATEVFGRISGADILLSSDRAKGNRNRTRGY